MGNNFNEDDEVGFSVKQQQIIDMAIAQAEGRLAAAIDNAIPESIQHLGEEMGTGTTLKLGVDGYAYWGEDPSVENIADMDYSDFAFGFSISGDVVTVNAGKVRHGTRTPVSVSSSPITISSDQTWIYVAYTYGGAGVLASTTSEPVDTAEVHNHVLYLVTLTGTVASVESGNIKHLGDIFIPGAFA